MYCIYVYIVVIGVYFVSRMRSAVDDPFPLRCVCGSVVVRLVLIHYNTHTTNTHTHTHITPNALHTSLYS